jgi:hypothetical protein
MVCRHADCTGKRCFDGKGGGAVKTRERLSRIKRSDQWGERLLLAQDRVPGTKHDREIWLMRDWIKRIKENPSDTNARFFLKGFGEHMAWAICKGDSALFREYADAIDQFYSHTFNPDKRREEIIAYCAPPDSELKELQEARDEAKRKKLRTTWANRTFQVKDIIAHLRTKKIPVDENTPRIVRRVCAELKIKLKA